MKTVYLIHRWSGGPDADWRIWIGKELRKLGFEVVAPLMPDHDMPVIEKWVGEIADVVKIPSKETYFIGHSIGCQAILRYLETVKEEIGGAVFVSGWIKLENLEDPETREIAEPWIKIPINFSKVRKNLPKSTLIISDNDPYDCFEENKEFFEEKIGSKVVVLHNAGHITEENGFVELPILLEEFKKLVN
jgi:predicted alpha/beta hydrolase family esterase